MRQSLLFATVLAAAPAFAEAPFDFAHTPGRLPKTVVPDAYRIDITPDLTALTLKGTEAIDLHVRSATADFVLNQAGLTLQSATLENGISASVHTDEAAQTVTLHFPAPVPAGRHTLTIGYGGPIPQTPSGIYYDDYKTAAGASKRMLVTQFEVSDARRMFPGWDEPAFKAVFRLTVTLPKDLTVLSNMPASRTTELANGLRRTEFGASPRMSTYLLALVAGDIAALHGGADGTAITAWTPAGLQDSASYALHAAEQILPRYNAYFGTKYPLPKLDLIAIPGNFQAGAMENWGAITFIDDAMLFDPRSSSPSTRETIFTDVAHEMAHQWSGDLVTLGWWDNIWLNEGFATWMEVKMTDELNPSWEVWPREHSARETAMGNDAQPSTHPIQQVIHDETEANTAFDAISYLKGSQIIRMVEDWLGPDVFRDGMRRYMAAHSYGNTTSADLWAALGAASNRNVAEVAASFTEQPGVPLVHVARSCLGGRAEVSLTQDRFTINDPHPKKLTWRIPVSLGGPGLPTRHLILDEATARLQAGSCDGALKANIGENGYYRTQYDAASLAALAHDLPKLAATDRANLLGDQYALYVADRATLADYLDLLKADTDERDIAVWTDTLSHLARIDRALIGSDLRPRFQAWAADYMRPEAARLGWDEKPGESPLDAVLRPIVLEAMGQARDAATVAEAHRRFAAFVKSPDSLAPALREPVLNIVGHTADQATWDTLKRLGIAATSTEEKLRYFTAMAAAADPALVAQNIAFTEAGEIPNGRIIDFIMDASRLSEQPGVVFQTVQPREKQISARFPSGGLTPPTSAAAAIGSSDPAIAKTVLELPSSNDSKGAHIWATRIADGINTAAELRERAERQLKPWLK